MIVMLVGPIDYWWNERFNTPEHLAFKRWRDEVSRKLVEAGHLVYRPHEAFKGAWTEKAQIINDTVINIADFLVNLTPPGVPAYGTAAEIARAQEIGKSVYNAPPNDWSDIVEFIVSLKDPYGKVHRKQYSREVTSDRKTTLTADGWQPTEGGFGGYTKGRWAILSSPGPGWDLWEDGYPDDGEGYRFGSRYHGHFGLLEDAKQAQKHEVKEA